MAFRFTPSESVEAGMRRIAIEQIEGVLAETQDPDADLRQRVHAARRRSKRVRALLRLVRPAFAHYRDENGAVRDAAAALSSSRDADVTVNTLKGVLNDLDQKQRAGLLPLLEWVQTRAREEVGTPATAQTLDAFRTEMEALKTRAIGWSLEREGFGALGEGLADTYAAMRRTMARARRTGKPDDLHAWRKHAKYHMYHLSLLREAAQDVLRSPREAASELADQLGDHHDLVVLAEVLAGAASELDGSLRLGPLEQAIGQEMQKHSDAAFALGRELCAEKPKALRRRLRAYWKSWRGEKR